MSVEAALEEHFLAQQQPGNLVYCEQCDERVRGLESNRMCRLPHTLLISLERASSVSAHMTPCNLLVTVWLLALSLA